MRATRYRTAATIVTAALVIAMLVVQSAQAQTYKVLHSFSGGTDGADGASPYAGVIQDANGNLYGTTEGGGTINAGTVFRISKMGEATVLHSFKGGADGANPSAGVIQGAEGDFYGTTFYGGDAACYLGCGTVFKLSRAGKKTVIYRFKGGTDGANPKAGVIQDAKGNLYGTTLYGGSGACSIQGVPGCGTVFKLDRWGKETVLYTFTGGADGGYPFGGVTQDAEGNLYGTASNGGKAGCISNLTCGVVFRLSQRGKETVLYSFTGRNDGGIPYAGVIHDARGNLYGTTYYGGDPSCMTPYGCGAVFKLSKTGKETVLYAFRGGDNGANPAAGMIWDAEGNLYGTTVDGGGTKYSAGFGIVFKLNKASKETVLYRFTGGNDGGGPYAGVIQDSEGKLYGTTFLGGLLNNGVVFELTPQAAGFWLKRRLEISVGERAKPLN